LGPLISADQYSFDNFVPNPIFNMDQGLNSASQAFSHTLDENPYQEAHPNSDIGIIPALQAPLNTEDSAVNQQYVQAGTYVQKPSNPVTVGHISQSQEKTISSSQEQRQSEAPPLNANGQMTCNHTGCKDAHFIFKRKCDWK